MRELPFKVEVTPQPEQETQRTYRNGMTDEQMQFAADVIMWLKTMHEAGALRAHPKTGEIFWPSMVDIEKSSLLHRIRSGKAPLLEPPPTSYSYPWYSLMDDPKVHECDVGGAVTLGSMMNAKEQKGPFVVINQAIWNVEQTVKEDEEYIVYWRKPEQRFRLWKHSDESFRNWRIQRIPEVSA